MQSISHKVSRHVIFDISLKNDFTSGLGSHVSSSNFYPYAEYGKTFPKRTNLTAKDITRGPWGVKKDKLHGMYHFMDKLERGGLN